MQTTDAIISAKDLTKKFGDFEAVKGISFEVTKGKIFAFLGPNGAGKTTTIKMLTTLLKPTSGSILLAGADPVHNQAAARRTFGIVFQDPSLDDELTADENLELHGVLYGVPKALRRERINTLFGFVDLADRRNDLVKHFSGGMKRRLEIARSLVHHPKILFLDEPTVGLDPQTRNKLWEYIQKLNKEEDMTVFFTTHYMEEAARTADEIAIMDHGQIMKTGTAKSLIEETGTTNLEDAFLKLTGNALRDEDATAKDHMRSAARMWRGGTRR
jgi:ABC-2 type transport system ATP-binding protein